MKLLTDHFDKVVVINCPHRPDRRERVMEHLAAFADTGKVLVLRGVVGDWTTAPADWRAGRGAWGCLRSHQLALEEFLHERDAEGHMVLESMLVLEDDVVFAADALERLAAFMDAVPKGWGQIYLGGQHRAKPTAASPGVVVGHRVNRTHAYAVSSVAAQQMYRHISYASDYRGTENHIDHQLELAHERRDWPVYCIDPWIAGQEAGSSNVSGKTNGRTFFDNVQRKDPE